MIAQNDYNRGYEVMYGQMIEADTKPDLKEGYYVARDLPLDAPQVLAKKFAHGPNVWPAALGAHFRETCMDYLERVTNLTEQVMQAIAVSLGYDVNYFDEFCHEPMAFYKLLHYPPQRDDAHKLQRGIGAHRDFGVITLLLQGDIPGLEVWDAEANDWYPAPPVEGAYVVNLGNLFEQWTNDKYISNVHVRYLPQSHTILGKVFFFSFLITNTLIACYQPCWLRQILHPIQLQCLWPYLSLLKCSIR